MQPTAALLVGLIVTTVAAGCVMVVPLPPFGTQRGAEEIESLHVGASKRQEVKQALGSYSRAVADRYEIFELSEVDFYLFGVLGQSGGLMPMGVSLHRVLVEYGPDEVLRSLHWDGKGLRARAVRSRSRRRDATWPSTTVCGLTRSLPMPHR